MKLLTPLGFIALIGLIILLIIYIVKPTYQSKVLSSTYIWKESLKYKTGKKPISKLKNILRVICQVLIVADCAMMLTTPMAIGAVDNSDKENIVILDGSANMMYENDKESRFDRAKGEILSFAEQSLKKQEPLTVIYAGQRAEYVLMKETSYEKATESISKLQCTYTDGDYYGALALADELCKENPQSTVYYYTSTKIANPADLVVVDMSCGEDWNAGIVDVRASFEENFFRFDVDIAIYGENKYVLAYITVNNINGTDETKTASLRVNCLDGQVSTAHFDDLEVYEYSDVSVVIKQDDESEDGFPQDDTFFLPDGVREKINIQYYSSRPNNFVKSALMTIKNSFADTYDIRISNVSPKDSSDSIKSSGCDIYIYEHEVTPSVVPDDGLVILLNPIDMPINIKDAKIGSQERGNFTFSSDSTHDIMKNVNAGAITASSYKKIISSTFEHLMFCNEDSVLAVKNTDDCKIAIMTVDLNRSNLPLLIDLPVMFYNMFEYYMPRTIEKSIFEVGDKIKIDARGKDVKLIDSDGNITALSAMEEISQNVPGNYRIEQTLIDGDVVSREFSVKIPKSQTNVISENNAIEPALVLPEVEEILNDILVYLACALIVLLAFERFLYSKENI